ncbi:hypothetical protein [Rhizobium binae]|uniref:hypothetical protein n=1 Tax=Rhizobium binae TaxID=1138190 RepID=UPI001C83E219|nr:hypothetical protein [Rhizobium binae]MBX4944610.1 hypothetical protein [Rhizobium binae]MBX4980641.1 hypothetical protein [Rhizobium binae]
MNHFTPFFPADALIRPPKLSDERAKDLETRLLEAIRMRRRAQRIAEAALLVSIGFTIAFTFALRM